MAYDALLALQAAVTKTATFSSTALDIKETPKSGLYAKVRVSTVAGTSPTADFKVQHSADNTTFTDLAVCNEGQVTAAGVFSININTSKRYIRLVTTIGGTAPSFVYDAYLSNAKVFPA